MKLAFETFKSIREQDAAVVIQSKFKSYYSRKRFIKRIHELYIMQVLPPTIIIQAAWKRYRILCIIKLRALSRLIINHYKNKAITIASWYKSKIINNCRKNCSEQS